MKLNHIPAVLLALMFAAGCASAPAGSADDQTSGSSAEQSERSQEARSESESASSSEEGKESSGQNDSTESMESLESMKPEVAEAAKENPVLNAVPLANFEDLKKAFEEQGFRIQDEKADGMNLDFTAENESGSVRVQAGLYESGARAQEEARAQLSALEQDDYKSIQSQSSPSARLTTLVNDFNSEYGYVGADTRSGRVYTFSGVLDGNRDQCMKVLQTLGFTDLQAD